MNLNQSICVIACLLFALTLQAQVPVFQETGGIVRVDLESAPALGEWVKKDQIDGHIGDGYLEFTGSNKFNEPGNSLLQYRVKISTTGTYLFRWHSRITAPGERTEYNDSWLRCPDASLFFAERNGSIVYPKGSGRTPVPEGSGRNNWFKAYQNRADDWHWGVFTSDNDPHDIYARFDSAGVYTIEISGRSMGHAIDRFVLVHSDASRSAAEDLAAPESDRVTTSTIAPVVRQLRLTPNPAPREVRIDLDGTFRGDSMTVTLSGLSGQVIQRSLRIPVADDQLVLPTDDLPRGSYVIHFMLEGVRYEGKFIR